MKERKIYTNVGLIHLNDNWEIAIFYFFQMHVTHKIDSS